VIRPLVATAFLIALLVETGTAADADAAIRASKAEEKADGVKPTRNFTHSGSETAYYRCYYTGKLELPASYDALKLKKGTKDGCRLNEEKYDVFFYPAEVVASGHAPVTRALAGAPVERVVTVVPHEDFHAQVRGLPDEVAEAASTLVGFLAGAAAGESVGARPLESEAGLFLRKADVINRYYEQLRGVYQSLQTGSLSKTAAAMEKQRIMSALDRECRAIQPAPRTFNRCVSAPNNAGLAFDYTYTRYYPRLYQVHQECGRDLRCTIRVIGGAPRKRNDAAVRYLEAAVGGRP
jgi:hypothetical protein